MQVNLTCDGVDSFIPIESVSVVESVNSMYFYFQVVTKVNIFGYVTMTIDSKTYNCYVIKSISSASGTATSLLFTTKQKENFGIVASAYIGDCTVEMLINSVGLCGREHDPSESFHWIVREASCYDFMRYVSRYAKTKQGGAPYLVMDFDGDIRYYDIQHRLDYKEGKELNLAITNRDDNYQYQLANPTNVNIFSFEEGKEANEEVLVGFNKGVVAGTYFNDYAKDYITNYNSNISYKTLIDRTTLTAQTVEAVYLGQSVRFKGLNFGGVVTSVTRPLPLNDAVVLPTTIKITCQLYERKS